MSGCDSDGVVLRWPDPDAVDAVLGELAAAPPLVLPQEVRALRGRLAEVARGAAVLLQAGESTEPFSRRTERATRGGFQVIEQLAVLLGHGFGLPVVKLGGIAGRFERRRGEATRLRTAYYHAATTLNLLRAMANEGPPSLAGLHALNERLVSRSRGRREFTRVTDEITAALRFMSARGAAVRRRRAEPVYAAQEAPVPAYERALTSRDPETGEWYCGGAHLVPVGDRTRRADDAHLGFLSGIANPLGVPVGPGTAPAELRRLCERLDPQRDPGRLVLISRMGAERVTECLPPLLEAVAAAGHRPVWACDPLSGNPPVPGSGHRTRRFGALAAEVSGYLDVHEELGTHAGGLHLEETGDQAVEVAFRMVVDVRRRRDMPAIDDAPVHIPRPRLRPAA